MTYLRIISASFSQRRSQIVVTFLCLFVSFLLLGLLLSVRQAFTAGTDVASSYRLRTQGASSVAASLPVSYASRISKIPGVRYAIYATAIPAAYQDNPQHLLLQAVTVSHFFDTFPELIVSSREKGEFLADKTSLIAGQSTVDRYGWKLGQTVVLQTNVLKPDGESSWTFHLNAIYRSDDPKIPSDLTFIRYGYLNDARLQGKDEVLGFIETINDPIRAAQISADLDGRFATSAPQLRTQPENEAVQKQLAQFGDFSLIVVVIAGVVFFSMFLLSHNVWYERVDMRRGEFAVMKVLGFRGRSIFLLVILEATLLTVLSAAAGTAAAALAANLLKPYVSHLLMGFYFPSSAYVFAAALAVGFGFLSSLLPARRAVAMPLIKSLHAQ